MSEMNHLCFHPDHGPHQCHCGMGVDHTTGEFRDWHRRRGIPVSDHQIA